jgi:hypothetical protein
MSFLMSFGRHLIKTLKKDQRIYLFFELSEILLVSLNELC